MKVEINKIVGYLPYDLYFLRHDIAYYGGKKEHTKGKRGTVAYECKKRGKLMAINKGLNKITTHCGSFILSETTKEIIDHYVTKKITYKPILKPLSMLTKEIEHNGEKFVPLVELAKISYAKYWHKNNLVNFRDEKWVQVTGYYKFRYNDSRKSFECIKHNTNDEYTECDCFVPSQIELFQKLFEWHFDVFGLIDKGLAIDINSLNK
jgi:hypothetical protein